MVITNTVELLKLYYEPLIDEKIKAHVEKILEWIKKSQERA